MESFATQGVGGTDLFYTMHVVTLRNIKNKVKN
jgi:hypothetical protein